MTDLFDYSGELPRLLTAAEWLERNPEHAYLSVLVTKPEETEQVKEGE